MSNETHAVRSKSIPREMIWSLGLITITIAGFSYSLGLTYPVISLVLEARGYSEDQIGLNGAMAGFGILVSSMVLPKTSGFLGYRLLIGGSAVLSAVLVLLLPHIDSFWIWCVVRFGIGVLVTGIFVGGESWLNELAEDHYRGRVMGIYAMVTAGGFAAGPLTLGLVGTDTILPFVLCAGVLAVCALAVYPLANVDLKPKDNLSLYQSILNLPKVSALIPTLIFAILAMAYFESSSHSLLPAYFSALDFSDAQIGIFVGVMFIGAIPAMPLMGWLADKTDSNKLLPILAVLTIICCSIFPWVDFNSLIVYPYLLAIGAVIFGTYTLALTEIGHRFKGSTLIAAMAGTSVAWGIGSTVGPYISGTAMEQFGNDALPYSFVCIYTILLVISVVRRIRKKKPVTP